jgi:protein SCO1/2
MRAAFIFLLILFAAPLADGHSLARLETDLQKREQYVSFPKSEREPFPDFALQDADGRKVTLASLRGKVVVLDFIYTSCPDVCPLHSELLAKLQKDVATGHMARRVAFVSVSVDPARDTPARMKAYGPQHGLDPANWLFLTSAQPDATRALAAKLGQIFTPGRDGEFTHSIVTYVIDREGHLRARFWGLQFDPLNLVLYVNALVNDVHQAGSPPDMPPSLWQRIRDLL